MSPVSMGFPFSSVSMRMLKDAATNESFDGAGGSSYSTSRNDCGSTNRRSSFADDAGSFISVCRRSASVRCTVTSGGNAPDASRTVTGRKEEKLSSSAYRARKMARFPPAPRAAAA